MDVRINHLPLFSQKELAAGLRIFGTRETAAAVAAQVYAIPAAEQPYYEWIDSTLMLTSCVSDELMNRILDWFCRTPEERAGLEAQMREFQDWVKSQRGKPRGTHLTMEDVIFDTRTVQAYDGIPIEHIG